MLTPIILLRVLPPEWVPCVPIVSAAIAVERLMLLGRIERSRLRQLQARVDVMLRPRALPPAEAAFVSARVCIPLKPMLEAAQFEERGCLEQMIEALRFFCERRVKSKGFVQLTRSEVVVNLLGGPGNAPTPDELRAEWTEALKGFSQAFRLTYSTWSLPLNVVTETSSFAAGEREDVAEVA
jgi:hypothetical protein